MWLIENNPDLADDIGALGWVADGISDSERRGLEGMLKIAKNRETTGRTLLDMAWVADGVSNIESSALGYLARTDGAETLLGMSWVADGVSETERETLYYLAEIDANTGTDGAAALLDMSWVADGVSNDERETLYYLAEIDANTGTDGAAALLGMSWVADGVSNDEREALQTFSDLSRRHPDATGMMLGAQWVADGVSDDELSALTTLNLLSRPQAKPLLSMSWVADGISDNNELAAVHSIARIAYVYPDGAAQVANMPFLQTLEATDMGALYSLRRMGNNKLRDILSHPTMKDGITDDETWIVPILHHADVARTLLDMPWVADGVSETERETVELLGYLALDHADTARTLLDMPWVADGVSETERETVELLGYLAREHADAARTMLGMPFLQTVEATDVLALYSLAGIEIESDKLRDILSHPTLKDGITDDETPMVAMLNGTLNSNPRLVDTLLDDPNKTTAERRTVELALAGGTDLVIVRSRPGAKRSMDLLENAVGEAENLMDKPFPKRYVGYSQTSTPAGETQALA